MLLATRTEPACRSAFERRYRDSLDGDGTVRIVFSRRGGMNYSDFRTYLNKLKSQQTNPNFDLSGDQMQIYWPAIDIEAVDALDHKNRAGLQVADVIAGAFSAAVEPNPYGDYEPRYAQTLRPRVAITTDGHFLGYGVKPVPKLGLMELHPDQKAFFEWYRK